MLRTEGDTFRAYRNGEPVLEYDAEVIEAALLSKHSQTAFLDHLSLSQKPDGKLKDHCFLWHLRTEPFGRRWSEWQKSDAALRTPRWPLTI